MNFKDILQEDNETTFMNPEEYGERHIVNGRSMNIIIDDFGLLPPVGHILVLDQDKYVITDAINEDGIYSISLEAQKS